MCKPDDRIMNAVNDLVSIKVEIEELQAEETELQEENKAFMGDEENKVCGDKHIPYKTVTSKRVDTTALKKILGDEMLPRSLRTERFQLSEKQ